MPSIYSLLTVVPFQHIALKVWVLISLPVKEGKIKASSFGRLKGLIDCNNRWREALQGKIRGL
jgi:hypothetical protein